MDQFSDLNKQKTLKSREGQISLKKEFAKIPESFTVSLSPILLPSDLQLFTRITDTLGERQESEILLDAVSEIIMILEDTKTRFAL